MYIAVALIIALIRCMPAFARTPPDAIQIKHVVFILKENHTFDNYFGAFPGTDGASSGKTHTRHVVPLGHAPDKIPADISHSSRAALLAMDDGRMDRFDLIRDAFQEGRLMNYTQYGEDQIPNYCHWLASSCWPTSSSRRSMAPVFRIICSPSRRSQAARWTTRYSSGPGAAMPLARPYRSSIRTGDVGRCRPVLIFRLLVTRSTLQV